MPFPTPFLSADNIEKVIDFKPRDTDVFVVTYPKCGTTWMQFIVWEIFHKGAVPPSPNQMMFRDFPFLEFFDADNLEAMPSPRLMKTHLPFNLNPYNPKSKYIYVVRNPWDCCVSYYYHHKMDPTMTAIDMTFDEYFELFITGQVGWGDFFDHVLSWFEHRNDPNVLFMTYESMKKDKKKTILSVAKFLGDSFFNDVKDEMVLNDCLKHTDFKYMKEIGMFFPKITDPNPCDIKDMVKELSVVDKRTATPEEFKEIKEVNFFRKGEVGDWRNHFSAVQVKKFNEYMSKKLQHTEMENFWSPLLEETAL